MTPLPAKICSPRKRRPGDAVVTHIVPLPHLDTFLLAAESCSFSETARALGLTQAAVSQRIQALEKALDESLFHRRAGSVLLTEAGRSLHVYARKILDLHAEARSAITGCEAPIGGELTIAASSIPGEHLLPALLSGFRRKYPGIRIRAAVSDSEAVMAQVERGEASVGLVGQKADSPNLEFRFLVSDRMALVIPPDHTLGKRRAASVGQLAAYPLILREAGSGLRHCFEKALDRTGKSLADLRVALELGSNEAIKRAVQRGVGVAVLSAITVQKEVAAGQLRALEIKGIGCNRDMFVVRDRRRVVSIPAQLFLTFLDTNAPPDLAP
jgi:DNA-binding transcriptional LysR family regulator